MSDLLSTSAIWTMVVGILAGACCASVGCYLVLRRMSMLGDAISHSVLPGIAVAVLWSGEFGGWPSFVGALALGGLCTLLIELLHRQGGLSADSSMGVVFSGLFSLGVIIITREARRKHIDADCILFGLIEAVPLDTVPLAGMQIPRAVLTLGAVAILVAAVILLFWKEFKIVSFDAPLASAMGLSASVVHYLLMTLVAIVAVACFEAVGSIVVVALFIVPPATAHLLTDRLGTMMALSIVVSAVAAVVGYILAAIFNTSVAGMIAVVCGMEFALAVILGPRHGILSKMYRQFSLSVRIAAEDYLGRLFREEEVRQGQRPAESVPTAPTAGVLLDRFARRYAKQAGWIALQGESTVLTQPGRLRAEEVVQSHRLWQEFAGDNLSLPADHRHEAAHRLEHIISPALRDELAREIRSHDHGDDLPK
jgi:manganese/zinc/iron transport system permease protein